MHQRRHLWIWVAKAVAIATIVGTGIYLKLTDLDRADKIASCAALLVALAGLAAPYLVPRAPTPTGGSGPTREPGFTVTHTGAARSGDGGSAVTGVRGPADQIRDMSIEVSDTGGATSEGTGRATTGIELT